MDATTAVTTPPHEPDEPRGHGTPMMPYHKVNYLAIFALLVVLTVVTVVVAFVHIERESIKVLVALTIASVKAAFVALYFMHLKFERWNLRSIALIPIPLALILIIMVLQEGF